MMMDKSMMCEKQVESCILNIPCERLGEIYFSPKCDFSKLMPCCVKSQTVSKGTMSMVGSVHRLEMADGSMCESEITYRDPAKFKIVYKILTSDIPCF